MNRKNTPGKDIISPIESKDLQTLLSISPVAKLKSLYSSQNTLPKLIEDEKIKAQSLDEYYVKLQILLSEDDEADKAALRDKIVGEKKLVEIEDIFKAINTGEKLEKLLSNDKDQAEVNNLIKLVNTEEKDENKISLLYKNLPNRSESEIKNIAASIKRIQADIGKILLLGSAGIGKTTLMHYLSYKWGKEDLWNDKFDYVFRIKLKELLNENWKDGYYEYFKINNLYQNKLNCFVHYCLGEVESPLSIDEIMNIQNKDKVLLLLDGYDEVAHLNTRDEFKKLIDEIFQYKNVIMSSRPNAIIENISSRFDRKVENTGWDTEGIEKYVNKSFEHDQELRTQLKSFLETHSQIKEICEVPINTALICLIWSNQEVRQRLQTTSNEDFNISRLYQEVVVWLGKRYFQKFENERIINITDGQILSTLELQFLQEVAFEALVDTGKLVKNELIKAKLDDKDFKALNIEKINKLGLLKAEGRGESIINLNHQFIHLTFQEFLAARHLKNQLTNNDIRYDATRSIATIVEVKPSLAQEAFIILRNLLSNLNNYHENIIHAAGTSLVELIELIPFDKTRYKQVHELLNIIYLTGIKNFYDFYKELHIKASTTLHKITDYITQEYKKNKNPEAIEWFSKCFKELPNINKTRVFLKEICKSILKSGAINELESQFILNCIKNYHFTFTVSVNKDHREIEGEIIFEDQNYEIFKNDNKQSNISIEEFAKILLAETDDPLAEQYKTHNPLFPNKGLGLKIAASDIKDVRSITNEKVISTEAYLLSFVSDIGDKFVILLEKRNIFGDHLIYKINEDNFEKISTIYPTEIDKETIKQIFKELEYEKLFKSVVQNKILEVDDENQIFEYSGKLRKNFLQNIKK